MHSSFEVDVWDVLFRKYYKPLVVFSRMQWLRVAGWKARVTGQWPLIAAAELYTG